MIKVDYREEYKHLYTAPRKRVVFLEVPEMNFLKIDGRGDPNTSVEFQEAVEGLFSLSYALKFMVKKGPSGIDYGVMPLEGLWWTEDMTRFDVEHKEDWQWTLMIMQPDLITVDYFKEALRQVRLKKGLKALEHLRFEPFQEGKAAQILHIGPFSEEGPTVQKVHETIEESGHVLSGKHHEIYLKDMRRAAPERLKTLIRQPVGA